MDELVRLLHEEGHSCVVRRNGIHAFDRRGVADLADLLERQPDLLRGAEMADKVVGKGAAALMVLGGVARLHADVLSEPALGMLERYGVAVEYDVLVPFIENRTKTGWCPVETLCRDTETPEACLPLIRTFLQEKNRQ